MLVVAVLVATADWVYPPTLRSSQTQSVLRRPLVGRSFLVRPRPGSADCGARWRARVAGEQALDKHAQRFRQDRLGQNVQRAAAHRGESFNRNVTASQQPRDQPAPLQTQARNDAVAQLPTAAPIN